MAEAAIAGLGAAGAAIMTNPEKVAKVASAVTALEGGGFSWLGLANEGGSRRNEMSVCNGTTHRIELEKWYIYSGKVKVPPEPYIQSMKQDDCLFHKTGSWAATGSSGILTYRLRHQTNLHILWDCPFNFNHYDNYIGLMLTSRKDRCVPDVNLFRNMEQSLHTMEITPKAESSYDLVCCGPSRGNSMDAGGKGPWGHSRPCKVRDEHYEVAATMGDRHATCSKITILEVSDEAPESRR